MKSKKSGGESLLFKRRLRDWAVFNLAVATLWAWVRDLGTVGGCDHTGGRVPMISACGSSIVIYL